MGRSQVAWRFTITGDWGGLVEAWVRDRKKVREGRREKVNQEAEDITKIRREVLGMFTTGKG